MGIKVWINKHRICKQIRVNRLPGIETKLSEIINTDSHLITLGKSNPIKTHIYIYIEREREREREREKLELPSNWRRRSRAWCDYSPPSLTWWWENRCLLWQPFSFWFWAFSPTWINLTVNHALFYSATALPFNLRTSVEPRLGYTHYTNMLSIK